MTTHDLGKFQITHNPDGSITLRGDGKGAWRFRDFGDGTSSEEVVFPFLQHVTRLLKAAPIKRVFIDMDGPLVNFVGHMEKHNVTADDIKRGVGHYATMEPVPGAIDAVRAIIAMGYDVFIATKAPTGNAEAHAEKVGFILQHLPELKRKIIITPDKGLLGSIGDYLIDDRPHKANCEQFPGEVIVYKEGDAAEWPRIIRLLRAAAPVHYAGA